MQPKILIIGLGKIGYSLADFITNERKLEVDGLDVNEKAQEKAIQDKVIKNIPKNFSGYDYYIICISTHNLENQSLPQVKDIFEISKQISKEGNQGALLCIDSTVAKGTSKKVLEILDHKIHVCHVPHRFYSGDPINHGHKQLRVLGGCEPCCSEKARYFFDKLLDIPLHEVSSADIAELTKLVENSYRFVEISFAEELKIFCDENKINFEELREAVNTKWNVNILEARDGINGHCLPKDAQMYLDLLKTGTKSVSIVESSKMVNEKYKEKFVEKGNIK